jgi:peptidoglycan hydrolase-like protein with peptidoglycan-binding domain
LLQEQLTAAGFTPGEIDGKLGANSYAAVDQALRDRQNQLPPDWPNWSNPRKSVAYLQLLCRERQIEVGKIDGYWGQQTDYAFATLAYLLKHDTMPPLWRDESPPSANPNNWPVAEENQLNAFYGATGSNQVKLQLPYPHRLSWDLRQTVHGFSCNARVHDSARRALTKVFDHYGLEKIKELRLDRFGGCLNVRKMRGGSQWSMHSWGIAIDYDPDQNKLEWGRERAAFARPDYAVWWRCWEEEGWTSLGRSKNYDWMHVQATRL